ncbi:MAG TPA: MFS transporter [Candidatus Acidoferrum sp.]|nr:MFS transporter [Candidatus Acidoferrum sp.]HVS73948.1 MFS transporter [Candidatus Acidoferrales bacterium]
MTENSHSLTAYQLRVLAVLALINFVNFADRQVIVPLVPLLRDQLGVTDAQLGSLQTWLLVILAVASIPSGFLADRISRKRIIAAGVIFWSLATMASGLALSFTFLLVARALVGVGEAAYAPAAQSMISGAFPRESRARALAVFASGMLLGGASGLALGGVVGELRGWHYVFILVGAAGLVPGLAILRLAEPPRPPRSEVVPLSHLLRVPAFLAMIAAGMFITFSSVSLLAWGIDFAVNYKDFSLREAAVSLAFTTFFSLVLGVLAGGYVADRLQKKFVYGRIIAIAGAFLFAAPFVLLAIESDTKWVVLGALSIAGFFMSWYHGPVTAVIHDMMPQRAHASSIGVYMFATQLVGASGPQLVGKISDMRDLQIGLRVAVGVMVGGALLMFLVIYFIRRDGLHHPQLESFRTEQPD